MFFQGNDRYFVPAVLIGCAFLSFNVFAMEKLKVCRDQFGTVIDCGKASVAYDVVAGTFLKVTSQHGLASVEDAVDVSLSYDDYYAADEYTVTAELVDNYNQIGSKKGTHWNTYVTEYKYITADVPSIDLSNVSTDQVKLAMEIVAPPLPIPVPPKKNGLRSKIRKKIKKLITSHAPSIDDMLRESTTSLDNADGQVFTTTEFKIIQELDIIPYRRNSIRAVHVFDPESAEEGYTEVAALKNFPRLKKIINITFQGDAYENENCLASAYVIQGDGDTDPLNKPLIICDGWDPRNKIGIQELVEDLDKDYADCNTFFSTIAKEGYDVVFVDFGFGAANIVQNAKVLLRVLEDVCQRTSSSEVTLCGYSMGGLIARVSLLLGEKHIPEKIKKIKKYVSIDAPHLGSQVNLTTQQAIIDLAEVKSFNVSNMAAYSLVLNPYYDIMQPATFQMLFSHAVHSEHDRLYDFIRYMGDYPSKNIEKISIADAGWKDPYPYAYENITVGQMNDYAIVLTEDDFAPGAYIDLWASEYKTAVPLGLIASSLLFNSPFGTSELGIDINYPQSYAYGEDQKRYKPTHMPLYTVFDINKEIFKTIPIPQNQKDLDVIADSYSPFDKIYLTSFDERHEHILFNENLADKLIASIKGVDLGPILNVLLLD